MGRGRLGVVAIETLISCGYQVIGVVPSKVELEGARELIRYAETVGVPVFNDLSQVAGPGSFSSIGVSTFYDRKVPPEVIRRFGTIVNIHNSPLPRYRGVRPINWALKNGERVHGVTLHDLTDEIDAGPILAQTTFAIDPSTDEVEDVYLRCLVHGENLLRACLPVAEDCTRIPQDESKATYYDSSQIHKLGDRGLLRRDT